MQHCKLVKLNRGHYFSLTLVILVLPRKTLIIPVIPIKRSYDSRECSICRYFFLQSVKFTDFYCSTVSEQCEPIFVLVQQSS